jgi:Post-segregation antitoxin CcdA
VKTSVSLPDALLAEARAQGIQISWVVRQALEKAVSERRFLRAGDRRRYPVAAPTVAELVAVMEKNNIPLTATLVPDTDYGDLVLYLEWYEKEKENPDAG